MNSGSIVLLCLALCGCSGAGHTPPVMDAGKSAFQIRAMRRDGVGIASIDEDADRYPVMKPLLKPVDSGYSSLDAGWHEVTVSCANDGSIGWGVLKADFRAGHYYHLSVEKRLGVADIWLADSVSDEKVAHVRIEVFRPDPPCK